MSIISTIPYCHIHKPESISAEVDEAAAIAQWLERLSSKQEVMSSILIGGFFIDSLWPLFYDSILALKEGTYLIYILCICAAPNASQRLKTIKDTTTYDRHYNDTAPAVQQQAGVHFPTHARTVVKGKGE